MSNDGTWGWPGVASDLDYFADNNLQPSAMLALDHDPKTFVIMPRKGNGKAIIDFYLRPWAKV